MDLIRYGNPEASLVLIQPVDDHDLELIEHEIAQIRQNTSTDFQLLAFKVNDWNEDLSPWKAPAVFGKNGFGEGAAATLKEILSYCEDKEKRYIIGGYSLAGLFALWAAYQTDLFDGVAAASPSVWFPGFADYMNAHEIKCERIYLSLGDKEAKTRNPVMARVADCIRDAHETCCAVGRTCVLEWNEGNHFRDPDLRTAKAFAWVMNQ